MRLIISFLGVALFLFILFLGSSSTLAEESPVDLYETGPDPIAPELPSRDRTSKNNQDGGKEDSDVLDMDIGQLVKTPVVVSMLDMEVSTVARTKSSVGKSPAAVFVITNEMIRRSGAKCIPEVLRLAPGVNVARIDAVRWAITIRGFNSRFADKILVQIDGRTLYTPTFAGVFWDVQNVVLEDVERIEVIRGPGGTIWGANAVNGVINILTKNSKDTQGGYFQSGAGTEELGFNTFRYGGQLSPNAHYRIYGMWYERDSLYTPYQESQDAARMAQTGFRTDWQQNRSDKMTLQGDYYNGYSKAQLLFPSATPTPMNNFIRQGFQYDHVVGSNILSRWTRTFSEESDCTLQAYYDHSSRHDMESLFCQDIDIFDLDFQYRFPLGRHDVICGCSYRNTNMKMRNSPFDVGYFPPSRNDNLIGYFIQDQISLREDLLYLIMGSKFEHNDYTGFEYQPSIRLLWTPSDRQSIWASISRAVRTPSYANANLQKTGTPVGYITPPMPPIPVFPVLNGNKDFKSEDVLAYEAGIRVQPTDAFYWDLAVFFNRYEELGTLQPGGMYGGLTPAGWPALFLPLNASNRAQGETYGFELNAGYNLNKHWKLRGTYSFLCMSLRSLDPGLQDFYMEGSDPRNQFNLWLSGELNPCWKLDVICRYVDNLPALSVPSYFVGDIRLAWKPRKNFEMFIVGRNLLDQSHLEYGTGDTVSTAGFQVQQEVHGGLNYRF